MEEEEEESGAAAKPTNKQPETKTVVVSAGSAADRFLSFYQSSSSFLYLYNLTYSVPSTFINLSVISQAVNF
jgi:hypothetical protein